MSSHLRIDLSLPLLHQGKVRDIYDIDSQYMLIVATDRLSAFDVIFEQPIASKGKILTEIANFWFDKTKHIVQNHLTKIKLEEVLTAKEAETLSGRAIGVGALREHSQGNGQITRSEGGKDKAPAEGSTL